VQSFTTYIPLSVYELESWLENPSIYVFDCSAAGMIVNALCERPDWVLSGTMAAPAMENCILLAACGAHEILPQNADLPADIFTSCLTTPIKIALRWYVHDILFPTKNPFGGAVVSANVSGICRLYKNACCSSIRSFSQSVCQALR
jgi:hypothetical protein